MASQITAENVSNGKRPKPVKQTSEEIPGISVSVKGKEKPLHRRSAAEINANWRRFKSQRRSPVREETAETTITLTSPLTTSPRCNFRYRNKVYDPVDMLKENNVILDNHNTVRNVVTYFHIPRRDGLPGPTSFIQSQTPSPTRPVNLIPTAELAERLSELESRTVLEPESENEPKVTIVRRIDPDLIYPRISVIESGLTVYDTTRSVGPDKFPLDPQPTSLVAVNNQQFLCGYGIAGLNGIKPKLTKDLCVAIDCEMVGVGDGSKSMLARVSIVNMSGKCLYDTFVQEQVSVVDYRTPVSGIRPEDMKSGAKFHIVRQVVATLIHNRILVGHALKNDLEALSLKFSQRFIRDTSRYLPFREKIKCGGTPSLKRLALDILKIRIQTGEHSSIEDAQAAMFLYMSHREQWEKDAKNKYRH